MQIDTLRHRLHCLGWRVLDGAQAPDKTWYLIAQSCGETIVALADTQQQVWSAACCMAMRLTREGYGRSGSVP